MDTPRRTAPLGRPPVEQRPVATWKPQGKPFAAAPTGGLARRLCWAEDLIPPRRSPPERNRKAPLSFSSACGLLVGPGPRGIDLQPRCRPPLHTLSDAQRPP